MKLSKSQKREIRGKLGSLALGFALIFGAYLCARSCEPQTKEPTPEPNYTTLENSDSLEIANPKYLEEYFEKW
jgi:hypothetical protein